MKKLTLDYNKWICGGPLCNSPLSNKRKENCLGSGYTRLLNMQGYMCCLGQFLSQCNIPNNILLNRSAPSDINKIVEPFNEKSGYSIRDSDFSLECMIINDNQRTTISEKTNLLKKICQEYQIELELVNFPQEILNELE